MNKDYRYEIKFALDKANLSKAYFWLNTQTFMKKTFPNRRVNSLYFDDINFSSVKDNLIGISEREKLRLRWYGNNTSDSKVAFEIKRRHGRLGSKKSYKMDSISDFLLDLSLHDIAKKSIEDLRSQNIVFNRDINPVLQVGYDREYYEDNEGIRMTIDHAITFTRPMNNQRLGSNLETHYPLTILEIKFLPDLKPKALSIIKSLDLTPKRHSKYLAGMAALGLATYI